MSIIDLRSDTVTKPTPEMLEAMAMAEVGDDVYGEDPTVRKLEELAAQVMGKEAGLLVTSGTMGNLVAVLTHTHRGDEVLLEQDSHINFYEVGGIAALAGVMPRLIRGEKGRVTPAGLTQAIRPANIHFPAPTLLCLENTHNRAGGTVASPGDMQAVISVARENGLAVHLDGARVFNAATALSVPVSELVNWCDSVMFCLSKGLGAPVGSMLVGSTGFIQRARKWRKMLGGGMRQAGVIAAAGLIALNSMIDRLKEDHANARFLAEGLAEIKGFNLDLASVQTNMVVVNLAESLGGAQAFLAKLAGQGVMAVDVGPHAIRFVTHKDVGKAEIEQALAIVSRSVI